MMDYASLINRLFSLQTSVKGKLHLSVIQTLCRELCNPQGAFRSIHVAGTNGKGSVCTMIAKGLELSGYKVGLNTSPHISCFRERISINGKLISEEDVCRLLAKIFETLEKLQLECSFFEITTALAFLYFAENNVDYALIETGLGGRLDATNIITPLLSVITSISLEHTEILGSTLEAITHEKAGIIKPGIPVVIGPTVNKNLIAVYSNDIHQIKGSFSSYKEENQAIATAAMHLLNIRAEYIQNALQCLPPCRFEEISINGKSVIFDVAHNPAGIQKLIRLLNGKYEVVIAVSSTKDLDNCLIPLLPFAERWFIIEAENGRSFASHIIKNKLLELGISNENILIEESINKTIHKAITISCLPVLICGSFFIMAAARYACNIHEPRDALDLNEKAMPIKTV